MLVPINLTGSNHAKAAAEVGCPVAVHAAIEANNTAFDNARRWKTLVPQRQRPD